MELTDEIRQKLEIVLSNVDKLEFKDSNIISLFNDVTEDYEWEAGFIGITKDGKIGYVFDSGCSCNDPEWDAGEEEPEEKSLTYNTVKGFELDLKDVDNWTGIFDLNEINSNLEKLIQTFK